MKGITQQQRIAIAKKKIRGIELTEEEKSIDVQICGVQAECDAEPVKAKEKPKRRPVAKKERKVRTAKDKAKYAITQKAKGLEKPKWMQEWIDYTDKSIPLGKRRVAYVRYLTHKGRSLAEAKYQSKIWIH